ncbi:CBS domain-containing protein [Streptomyces scopuliridis]|uniref:CBS domain-containing protein n=1 Tax=Streptomyces scopuliridis TaxID=452529 RepID=UPI0035DD190C
MRLRRAGDVMTRDVLRVGPATPVMDVARSLVEHGIGGLPVVDDDWVLGAVSRGGLTRLRAEPGLFGWPGQVPLPGWRGVGNLMSAPAATVHAVDSTALTGRIRVEQRVGRLLVVDEGARLIGIITGRDLLRVFVRPGSDLRDEVMVPTPSTRAAIPTATDTSASCSRRPRRGHHALTHRHCEQGRIQPGAAVMNVLASRRGHTPG